jgi:hypothetical protein
MLVELRQQVQTHLDELLAEADRLRHLAGLDDARARPPTR